MCFVKKLLGRFISDILTLLYCGFIGLVIAGISPTKAGGTYAMNGWAMTQFLLSGKNTSSTTFAIVVYS